MRDVSHFPSRLRLIRCVHARYAQFARRVYAQCTRWVRTTALSTRQRYTVTPPPNSTPVFTVQWTRLSVPSTLIGPPCVTSSTVPGSKQHCNKRHAAEYWRLRNTKSSAVAEKVTTESESSVRNNRNSLPADTTDFGSLTRFRNSLHRIDFSSFLTVD